MDITFLIPVYNGQAYLPACIDSLLHQTDQSFSVIFVDDGSTDESLTYLRNINDPRFCILTQPNQGITAALNRGLQHCRTDWVIRLDADDIALPNRVELTKKAIKQYPDTAMFHGRATHLLGDFKIGQFFATICEPQVFQDLIRSGYLPSVCHPSVAYNRHIVAKVGGYRLNLPAEDLDLFWRIGYDFKVRFISEPITLFRMNMGSISSKSSRLQVLATLYIQCLLLGRIHDIAVPPFEDIEKCLDNLAKSQGLYQQKSLRIAAMALVQHQYLVSFQNLFAVASRSPKWLCKRLLGPRHTLVRNGIQPSTLLRHLQSFNANR